MNGLYLKLIYNFLDTELKPADWGISSDEDKENNSTILWGRKHSYIIGNWIGPGNFGKVKKGVHIKINEKFKIETTDPIPHDCSKVAIKILEKDKIQDVADVERVAREIHILKIVRHPNVIQMYEIIETKKQLYLIMEYAEGGELFDYIVSKKRLGEKEAWGIYQQIIGGIEYLSKLGIAHRDLKPENLLLGHNRTIKIVNFSLSNIFQKGETLKTACGSPWYAAPEMIEGKDYHGTIADIWSSGVILFGMLWGYLPFEDPNLSKLYK